MNVKKIKGKYNTAIAYAGVIEDKAINQIKQLCDQEFAKGSKIRVMPDVHAGKGCTIGTTMTITDKVVPNIVGVDIGCGMLTTKLNVSEIDFAKFDEAAHFVPSGHNVWNEKKQDFDLKRLACYDELINVSRIENSVGTLGGGNHFIEIDQDSNGAYYLVIHTGSRNLGKQVAEIYQRRAVALNRAKNANHEEKCASLVREYKKAGRAREIPAALNRLEQKRKAGFIPENLCYVYGKEFENYLRDAQICQEFARQNRELIAKILLERAGLEAIESFHTIHNYIDAKEMILRKGAIAAHKGERVLIPINMRDGSILALGKGDERWNYSAPHGAGRIMSRGSARKKLSLHDYKDAMRGIYSTTVNEKTLDEAPFAYKKLEDIIDDIKGAVDVLEILKPVYNFKSDEETVS